MRFLTAVTLALLASTNTAELNGLERSGMLAAHSTQGLPAVDKKGVMLMNRIAPSTSVLYVANADGTNERKLLGDESRFEYHGSFSPDGQWVTFTTERHGDGQSDIYRIRINGSDLQSLRATPSVEDAAVMSPDGQRVAYVSTEGTWRANIFVHDLASGLRWNLTDTPEVKGWEWSPDGHFMPAWSPDGEWIAFSSDRNTAWTGHGNGTGWEHTQELSIYAIRPNGTDFRLIAKMPGYSLGSPEWSADGKRLVFYHMLRTQTWNAHRPEDLDSTETQIYSVDFLTGKASITQETSSYSLKIAPSYIGNTSQIGYLVKGPAADEGINYTQRAVNGTAILGSMRSPSWSPDGKYIVYEKTGWDARPQEKRLYSWDPEWEYRFTDVFPVLSNQGRLAMTWKQHGNSSIVTMSPDGTDFQNVFKVFTDGIVSSSLASQGLAGAFQPTWSPDGEWIAFGLGAWFQERTSYNAYIFRVTANGSHYEQLTESSTNAGFPTYNHDGTKLVYRLFGPPYGLRQLDLTTGAETQLTNEKDNLPQFSPDGSRIMFTRRMNYTNFDICTTNTTGGDLRVLTTSGVNDAHATWTTDGRILWATGMWGFRMEAAMYDQTFQPYGQIMIMDADGSNKKMLEDSLWEDSMPLYLPNELLTGATWASELVA